MTAALKRREWWWVVAGVGLVLLAYLPVRSAGFVWDDDAHLTANRCIVGPLGLKEIWTTAEANYFPLVLTHLWGLHAIFGLNPLPYHVVNVLLHAASAILLWQVLRRLRVRGAWLGAGWWALHPVQVESVAWISELKNTQSAVFYLLAIWFYLGWFESAERGAERRVRDYGLALGCAVCAILSKPSTVMLPVVLALCGWWQQREWRWRDLRWLVPFFALSLAAGGWTIWEQKIHSKASGHEWDQSWPERAVVAGRVIWFYLGKLAWPHPLSFIYPRWIIDATQPAAWLPLIAAVGGLGVLGWGRFPAGRAGWFAGAYFVGTLFPVLGFFNVYFFRFSFVADHFQYLASMGVCALAGAGMATWWARANRPARWALGLAGGLGVCVAIGLVRRECAGYADTITLWQVTAARNPAAWLAHNNLAIEYSRLGRWAEAQAAYERALAVKPDDAELHSNYGNALLRLSRREEAVRHFDEALRLRPDLAEAHNSLAVVLLQDGHVGEAIAHSEQAIRSKSDYPDAYFNLGNALVGAQRVPEAITHFQRALALRPGDPDTLTNLAGAHFREGRYDLALESYAEAVRQRPNSPAGHYNLASTLVRLGRIPEALQEYETALQLRPDFLQARITLGSLLAETGDLAAAIAHYEKAAQLAPQDAGLRETLARWRAQAQSAAPKDPR